MKKYLLTTLCCCALPLTSNAEEYRNTISLADPDIEWRHSLTYGHFFEEDDNYVAYNFTSPSGLGAQILYTDHDGVLADEIDFLSVALTFRQYYDTDSNVRLYWGAGVGAGVARADIGGIDSDTSVIYADAVLGLNAELTDFVDFHLGTRVTFVEDISLFGSTTSIDNFDFGVEAGFTIKF